MMIRHTFLHPDYRKALEPSTSPQSLFDVIVDRIGLCSTLGSIGGLLLFQRLEKALHLEKVTDQEHFFYGYALIILCVSLGGEIGNRIDDRFNTGERIGQGIKSLLKRVRKTDKEQVT